MTDTEASKKINVKSNETLLVRRGFSADGSDVYEAVMTSKVAVYLANKWEVVSTPAPVPKEAQKASPKPRGRKPKAKDVTDAE